MKKTLILSSIIWIIGFLACLVYVLLKYQADIDSPTQDAAREYLLYKQIVESGSWQLTGGLLNSTLSVTLLPAFIQRLFHTDILWTFKLYSSFIMPFLPVLIYLIVKKFLSYKYAFVSALLFISQYGFWHAPVFQRTIIALIFMALILWVIYSNLSKKRKITLIVLSSLCLVLSHYTVAIVSIIVLIIALLSILVYSWFMHYGSYVSRYIAVSLGCLILFSGIWYGYVTRSPVSYAGETINNTLLQIIGNDRVYRIDAYGHKTGEEVSIWDRDAREPVIQFMFGAQLPNMSVWQYINMYYTWSYIGIMVIGFVIMCYRGLYYKDHIEYLAILGASIFVGMVCIVVPAISYAYGLPRTYLQITIPLSVSVAIGIKAMVDIGKSVYKNA